MLGLSYRLPFLIDLRIWHRIGTDALAMLLTDGPCRVNSSSVSTQQAAPRCCVRVDCLRNVLQSLPLRPNRRTLRGRIDAGFFFRIVAIVSRAQLALFVSLPD